jgi:predicted CXXCH cytochrome family protein
VRLVLILAAVVLPSRSLATGGHDAVGCMGCHSVHAGRGAVAFALPANTTVLDPRTGKANETISALCLACHAEPKEGGRGAAPVSSHFNHPFSVAKVNPKLARVPPELLRDGRFECVGCHDPHPSNPNYRYLRVAVTRAPTLSELCSLCHPRKADPAARAPSLFTSMDERAERPAPVR